jgi:FMN phosphatase YigB (HAD superfamily)
MFTTAFGLLGLGPHEVIHVGDALTSDVAGAARLGMPVSGSTATGVPHPKQVRGRHAKWQTSASYLSCLAAERRRARQQAAG